VFESGTEAERAERADTLLVTADCRPRLVRHGDGRPFHQVNVANHRARQHRAATH
jgi:hypothetical protein